MPTRTTKSARVFKARLTGDFAEVQRKARIILDSLTFQLLVLAAQGTPVDTGRLRSGWQAAGVVSDDEILGPFQKSGSGAPAPSLPQFGAVLAALADLPLNASRFVFNNVEYGVFVEEGTDRMRGHHMLANAVRELAA